MAGRIVAVFRSGIDRISGESLRRILDAIRCAPPIMLVVLLSLWTPEAYAQSYSYVTKWGSSGSGAGQFAVPYSLTLDRSGNVFVSDNAAHRIQKFSHNGSFMNAWGTFGSGNGQFKYPFDVAVDSSGCVYIADCNNHRIQKFTSDGTFLAVWGTSGSGDGQFAYPQGVAVDSNGYIYVADTGNHRVQKLTSAGLYVVQWGGYGTIGGKFNLPTGLTVDASGNVYVVDLNNHRIQKFTSSGMFVTTWGNSGGGNSQLADPRGIAVDGRSNVYVTDVGSSCIKKFTSEGDFVTAWGTFGSGNGQLWNPTGIALGGSGEVYVSEMENDRVQEFAMNLPAPVITAPNAGADYSTNSPAVTLSGTCDSSTPAIHVNGSATGVTYTWGDTTWSYTSGALSDGVNTFSVTAYNGVTESVSDTITVTVDTTPPTASLSSTASDPTKTSPIPVIVTFSEAVAGFTAADITPGNASVSNFSGSGASYSFNLVPNGQGVVTADIAAGAAQDAAGNNATAAARFSRTYDTVAPTVSISAPSASITAVGPVTYTVTYGGADSVTLASGAVTLNKTGTANASIAVSGTGNASRTVTLSSVTGAGTLGISIAASTASDAAANTAAANTAAAAGPSASFSVDNTSMAVNIGAPSTTLTRNAPVCYTVTYSNVTTVTLAPGNITLNKTGTANATVQVTTAKSESTLTRTVTLFGITGTGTLGFSIAAGTATDDLSLSAPAAGPSATFTVDNTPPLIACLGSNPVQVTQNTPYVDAGATAADNVDGVITSSIVVNTSGVDTSTVGTYHVTYNVTDAAGNPAAQVIRTVEVLAPADALSLAAWPVMAGVLVAALWVLRRHKPTDL